MPRRPLSFSGRAGDLQQGREQVLRETVEERETRLQRMRLNQRLRLVSETQEERETRLQRMGQRTVSRRLERTERPAFNECSRDWHLRLLRTERPAFNKCVSTSRRGWHLRLLRTETCLRQMCINKHQRLASETTFLLGLTQVEEMLISAVMPIIYIYRLPHGQYGYSGHVINLHQDVLSFASTLKARPTMLAFRLVLGVHIVQGVPRADESVCRVSGPCRRARVAMASCYSSTMCSNIVCAYVSPRSSHG